MSTHVYTKHTVGVELDLTSPPALDQSVIWDVSSGSFALTSSLGGGSSGVIAKSDPATDTVNPATTLNFLNGDVFDDGVGGADIKFDLQGVTNNGQTTTNGSRFFYGILGDYMGATGIDATVGWREDGTLIKTFVTPIIEEKPFFPIGVPTNIAEGHPQNYIVSQKSLIIYPSGTDGGGTDDGGHTSGTSGGGSHNPNISFPGTLSLTFTGSQNSDPRSGLLLTPTPNIFFFNLDASSSISGTLQPISASAQIRYNTGSNSLNFLVGSTDEPLKEVMFISSSGDNPKIGIGTNTPLSTFDIKTVEDDPSGSQFFIRSSRILNDKGANIGDTAGSLNFIIDSGSYIDVTTSGSIATITTDVVQADDDGVIGDLIFKTANNTKLAPVQIMKLSNSAGEGSSITGSLIITSYAKANKLAIGNIDPSTVGTGGVFIENDLRVNDNTQFGLSSVDTHLFNGSITASNDINASGAITASNAQFTTIPAGAETTFLTVDGSGNIKTRTSGADGTSGTSGTNGTSGTSFLGSVTGTTSNGVLTYVNATNNLAVEPNFTFTGTVLTVDGRADIETNNIDNVNSSGALTSAGDYGYGSDIYFGSDVAAISAGRVYYINSAGSWIAATDQSEAAVSGLIAVATGTPSTAGMLLRGIIYKATSGNIGSKVYLGGSGVPTTTLPTTSGDFVRIIGHVIATNIIYFNPSNDYIELV